MAALVDGHHLLPRYREGTIALERRNALAVREAELAAEQAGKPIGRSAPHDPVDQARLRGIPAIGGRGSWGGAIPGTRPDVAVLRLDRRPGVR
jgi:hypothetical protein